MATFMMSSMSSNKKEIEIETLWTSYRKLLLGFIGYLHEKGKEKQFKIFFRRSVPDKYWDVEIEDWLLILEQSQIVNMNELEILCSFLNSFKDSRQISAEIREFRRRLQLVEMILKMNVSKDLWIYSPPIKVEKFKISEDLHSLMKQWEEEIEHAPNISETLMEICSQATQRIADVASESNENNHSCFLEALFIAQFLTKMEGMAQLSLQ